MGIAQVIQAGVYENGLQYIFQMATFIGKTSAEGEIMINQWIEGCQTLRQTQMNWLKDPLKIPELCSNDFCCRKWPNPPNFSWLTGNSTGNLSMSE